MITFNCPKCKRRFQSSDDAAGKEGTCPSCKAAFIIPAVFEEAPPVLRPVPTAPVTQRPAPTQPSFFSSHLMLIAVGVLVVAGVGITVGALVSQGHAAPQAKPPASLYTAVNVLDTEPPASPAPAQVPAAPPPAVQTMAAQQPAWQPSYQPTPPPAAPVDSTDAQAMELRKQINELQKKEQVQYLIKEKDQLQQDVDRAAGRQSGSDAAHAADAAHGTDAPKAATLGIADVVAQVSPSVVTVRTDIGVGAGWIAFETGLVITNHHVIRDGHTFSVCMVDAGNPHRTRVQPCSVIAIDLAHDLALLRVDGAQTASPIPISSTPIRAGDSVIAIGNPAMGDTILDQSVTSGIISNVERQIDNKTYIQTTAAINPGNSGGPLLNSQGEVVGIVTAKGVDVENIGFAVPVTFAAALYEGRFGKFAVNSANLEDWERQHAIEALAEQPGSIAVKSVVNGMMIMGKTLIALATERNKVLTIDLPTGKITSEIFPGTQPAQMLPGDRLGQVWVMCVTSKSFTLVDTRTGRVVTSVHVVNEPVAFTMANDRIWFVDAKGGLAVISTAGGQEREISVLDVRSVVFDPSSGRGQLLCGTTSAWLISVPTEHVLSCQKRLDRLDEAELQIQALLNQGDQAAWKEKFEFDAERNNIAIDLKNCIKSLNQPDTQRSQYGMQPFENCLQSIFLDARHHRLYFNRCAMESDNPEHMLGLFQEAEHSLVHNPAVGDFIRRYPYFNQILAVSPDGHFAASGTHLFNADDFTIVAELPVPCTSVAFSADSRSLYLADPFNGQIDTIQVPGGDKPADKHGADAPGSDPKTPAAPAPPTTPAPGASQTAPSTPSAPSAPSAPAAP